jgi:hypothetical protein
MLISAKLKFGILSLRINFIRADVLQSKRVLLIIIYLIIHLAKKKKHKKKCDMQAKESLTILEWNRPRRYRKQ